MREAFSRETLSIGPDGLGTSLVVGGLVSNVIPCIASVDALMGGCDR